MCVVRVPFEMFFWKVKKNVSLFLVLFVFLFVVCFFLFLFQQKQQTKHDVDVVRQRSQTFVFRGFVEPVTESLCDCVSPRTYNP